VGETDLDDKLHRLGLILERAGRADNADTVHRAISVISILAAKGEMLAYQVEQLEAALAAANAEVERLRPREMTLGEAVKVLNEYQYEGFGDWKCDDATAWPASKEGEVQFGEDGVADLGPFLSRSSVFAVAEKLLRDGGEGGGV
jgi:hypothetical protein